MSELVLVKHTTEKTINTQLTYTTMAEQGAPQQETLPLQHPKPRIRATVTKIAWASKDPSGIFSVDIHRDSTRFATAQSTERDSPSFTHTHTNSHTYTHTHTHTLTLQFQRLLKSCPSQLLVSLLLLSPSQLLHYNHCNHHTIVIDVHLILLPLQLLLLQ